MLKTVFALGAVGLTSASHYRGGNLAWSHTANGDGCEVNEVSGNSDYCVTFTLTTSWRRSYEWPEDSNAPFTGEMNPFTGKSMPASGDQITLTGLSPGGAISHKNRWYGDSGPRGSYAGRFGPETQLLHGASSDNVYDSDNVGSLSDGSTQLTDIHPDSILHNWDNTGMSPEGFTAEGPTGNDGSQDNHGAVGFWSGDGDQLFPISELTGTVTGHNNVEDWIIVEHEYHYSYPRPYVSRAPYFPGPYSAGDHDGANFNTGLAVDDSILQENQPFAYEPWLATFAGCCRMANHQINLASDVWSLKAEFVIFEEGNEAVYIGDDQHTSLSVVTTTPIVNSLPMASCSYLQLDNGGNCHIPTLLSYIPDEALLEFEDKSWGISGHPHNQCEITFESEVIIDLEHTLHFSLEVFDTVIEVTGKAPRGQYNLALGITCGTSYTEAEIIVNIQDNRLEGIESSLEANISPSSFRGTAVDYDSMMIDYGVAFATCYVGFNCDFDIFSESNGRTDGNLQNFNYQWYSLSQQSAYSHKSELRAAADFGTDDNFSETGGSSDAETWNGEHRTNDADQHSWWKYNGLPEGANMFSISGSTYGTGKYLTDLIVTYNNPVYRHRYNHDSTFDEESRDLWSGLLSEEEADQNGYTEVAYRLINNQNINGDANDLNNGLGGAIVKLWAKFEDDKKTITDITIVHGAGNDGLDGFTDCDQLLPLYYGTVEEEASICVKRGSGRPIVDIMLHDIGYFDGGADNAWILAGDADRAPFEFNGNYELRYTHETASSEAKRTITWNPTTPSDSVLCIESVATDYVSTSVNSGSDEGTQILNDGNTPSGLEFPNGQPHLWRLKSEMKCVAIMVREDDEDEYVIEGDKSVNMGSCVTNQITSTTDSLNHQDYVTYSLGSGPGAMVSPNTWEFCPDQDWSGYSGNVCLAQTDAPGNGRGADQSTTTEQCFSLHVNRCKWTVQEEDTLIEIAARFDTNWLQLWHLNIGLTHPDHGLFEEDQDSTVNVGHLYTVEWHDNMDELADRFGTTQDMIFSLNKDLGGEVDIEEGQLICIQPNSCHTAEYTEDHKYNGEHHATK